MHKKIIIVLTGLMLGGFGLFAQQQDSIPAVPDYSSIYHGDARIDSVLRLNYMQNTKYPTISGYRIQIYKGTGNNALNKALDVQNKFEQRYKIKAYVTFNEPYYRVRVGDFRSRLDAIRFLNRIKNRYPLAWEIKDQIRFSK
ncbi:MAG: SPOR domain-containing protein [Bacteroidales bacterium]|nr:SPOR domain-containing protein [Bacteroidales bacterium]